jgi:thymidylate kinase
VAPSAITKQRFTTSKLAGTRHSAELANSAAARLLDGLHENAVRYCHFKSNANVAAGVSGLTDLDLLVDREDAALAEKILAGHGFKRLPAHPSRWYPGVDDYFALDEDTGRLVHLHLHYRLIGGERFFKNYGLPWEGEFLDTRVLDEDTNIFVAHPALEWLLLVCRAALKIRWRDRLRVRVTAPSGERRGMLGEHHWLAERVEAAAVTEHARRLLGERPAELVGAALAEDLRFRRLTDLRRALLRNPRVLRGYRPLPALAIRWSRELRWIVGSVNRRYLRRPFPYRRSGSSGGLLVAVVGSDGAGKSSLTETLHSWLAGKVDVLDIYFGSGQGRSSLLRWPMKAVLRVMRRSSNRPRRDPEARRNRDVTLPRALWALALAREKRAKLRRAIRARERGFIVICDRYPQAQFHGVSDGPLLARWYESGSGLKRALARWERRIYELAAETSPDVVVRLLVTPEKAAARRPTDDPEELTYRAQLVRDLRFANAPYGIVDVDADQGLDSVILDVKRRLWPLI